MTPPKTGTTDKAAPKGAKAKGKKPAGTRSKTRSLCSCLLTVSGFILTVFGLVFYNLHQTNTDWFKNFYSFHRGDQVSVRALGRQVNTQLCGAYDVDPWDFANVYLLPRPARYSSRQRRQSFSQQDIFPNNAYNDVSFYLLPASSIHVQACSSTPENFYFVSTEVVVIKGLDNWLKWENTRSRKHVLQSITVKPDVLCRDRRPQRLHVIVTEADHYHVAMARTNPMDDNLLAYAKVNVTLHRTVYDVRDAWETCLETRDSCTVNVTYNSDSDVVVDFLGPAEGQFQDISADFTMRCQQRVIFWVGIFAVLPIGLIVLLVSCCCCCHLCCGASSGDGKKAMMKKKLELQRAMAEGDKATLVDHDHLPPDYNSVTASSTSIQVE